MTTEPSASAPRRRALITGGAGFIGSHLVDHLLERGDAVTVIDNLSTGRRPNLPQAHERLRFIEAELSDALVALGRGERFDEIYHLAAAVGVRLVIDEPIASIETNVGETLALLKFAMDHGPQGSPAPTLIASSSEVYGKADKQPFSEEDDVVYGPTTKGRWSYACSKAIDEYLALAHHQRLGLPVVIARFFNTVGPRQVGSYGMVLPNFVKAALENRDLEVHGDGLQSRCFCDVRDVVTVLPRLVGTRACHGRVFNVGSDRVLTIMQLAEAVIRTLGSSSRIRLIPYETAFSSAAFEDLRKRQPDLSRLRSALGFEPRYTLEQTVRDIAAGFESGSSRAPSQGGAG